MERQRRSALADVAALGPRPGQGHHGAAAARGSDEAMVQRRRSALAAGEELAEHCKRRERWRRGKKKERNITLHNGWQVGNFHEPTDLTAAHNTPSPPALKNEL